MPNAETKSAGSPKFSRSALSLEHEKLSIQAEAALFGGHVGFDSRGMDGFHAANPPMDRVIGLAAGRRRARNLAILIRTLPAVTPEAAAIS